MKTRPGRATGCNVYIGLMLDIFEANAGSGHFDVFRLWQVLYPLLTGLKHGRCPGIHERYVRPINPI